MTVNLQVITRNKPCRSSQILYHVTRNNRQTWFFSHVFVREIGWLAAGWILRTSIYGALATSHKGKSRVDAEADFDRLFICIVGVECGVM